MIKFYDFCSLLKCSFLTQYVFSMLVDATDCHNMIISFHSAEKCSVYREQRNDDILNTKIIRQSIFENGFIIIVATYYCMNLINKLVLLRKNRLKMLDIFFFS